MTQLMNDWLEGVPSDSKDESIVPNGKVKSVEESFDELFTT